MKKAAFFSLLLVLTFLLTSCMFYAPSPYKSSHSEEEIELIEICYYKAEYSTVDLSAAPVAVIEKGLHAEIVDGLKDLGFKQFVLLFPAAIDPNVNINGYAVRITYSDGSAEIIAPNLQISYQNGKRTDVDFKSCDRDKWNEFINKYVEMQMVTEETV